jgi:hypothetical protein
MASKINTDRYWTRVFIPCLLILFALAFYLLFFLPQTQMISSSSVFKAMKLLKTNSRVADY